MILFSLSWLVAVTAIENAFYLTGEPIPEPTTMLLVGTGLVGVAGAARRKKRE